MAPRKTRKVVTALFCDVTGSTSLGEELDPEVLREVLNRYFADIRATIERHGGLVEKFIGDAVMAVFGIPQVHEDDALRAVRAAAEIRERLPAVGEEVGVSLRFRTGVNTGPVLMSEGENLAIGDAVNVAARLEQAAKPGEIVIGHETLQLVRDAVEVEALEPLVLKGKSNPVQAYKLLSLDPVAPGFARHLDTALVGRERELRLLTDAWARTQSDAGCHLFTILGSAGVGKSRLVGELLERAGGQAAVLRGRCLHYGEGITFWPLVEALTPLGERAHKLLGHLSGDGSGTPVELFWEARRLLESVAATQPLILYIDDLQWAEPMLLDLLDHVVDISRGAPILLLCTARPELLEDRPGWGGGKLNATAVLLEPLGARESQALLDQLADGLDAQARAQVIAASDGNPLFLEEMVALAQERGTVVVPPTIQALLAARLERLGGAEREVLERGAVEGEVFHRLALKALADEQSSSEVELQLQGLVRKELIRPHPATLGADEAFRFRHLLIRDAAYDGLPKASRAVLHEQFARWLEIAAADLSELDEIAGWHLEQAVHYQRELGREVQPSLAIRAATHLHAAGRRASARGDGPAARSLLERALALISSTHSIYALVAVDLAEELIEESQLARVDQLLAVAEQHPDVASDAALVRFKWLLMTHPQDATATIEARLPQMLERLTLAGDERGLAKAHMAASSVLWLASRAASAGEEARLAAEHARLAGDEGLRSRALVTLGGALYMGPAPASEIASHIESVASDNPGPLLAAFQFFGRASLAKFEGRFDEALAHAERAIELVGALQRTLAETMYQSIADFQLDVGNLEAALAAIRRADAALEAAGERANRSTTQAILADISEAMGDREAAVTAADLAEQLSAEEDVINFAMTHRVRARLARAQGDLETAEQWARSGVRYALKTDFPRERATTKTELARVLAARGRLVEAASEAHEALAIAHAKGDKPLAAQAQAVLDEVGPVVAS
ncbi:MAG TPA: adenylate/guanylate cyclase domain-containing protein [Solirubrobacteraceae bacterium]|jgi:class 3 adenylate cyclase/tetratricopeptide (TPR) repeat protein|nr:adenylate/guanylate cyclase domain-containing protein [Solirubrobacteraceae bacterium]